MNAAVIDREVVPAATQAPTLQAMSRAVANEMLTLWRAGAAVFTRQQITLALYVTGDLDSPM